MKLERCIVLKLFLHFCFYEPQYYLHSYKLFADLPGFVTPSVITGDSLRPDLLLEVHNKCLYILELTIGYETDLTSNIARKDRKYQDLIRTL